MWRGCDVGFCLARVVSAQIFRGIGQTEESLVRSARLANECCISLLRLLRDCTPETATACLTRQYCTVAAVVAAFLLIMRGSSLLPFALVEASAFIECDLLALSEIRIEQIAVVQRRRLIDVNSMGSCSWLIHTHARCQVSMQQICSKRKWRVDGLMQRKSKLAVCS